MWIHIPQSEVMQSTMYIARFRMPFFVLLVAYFLCWKLNRQLADRTDDFRQYLAVRLRRVYIPFIGWTAFYLLVGGMESILHGEPWPRITWALPVTGNTSHLWFLPFIMTIGVLIYPVALYAMKNKSLGLKLLVGIGLIGLGLSLLSDHLASFLISPEMKGTTKITILRACALAPCALLGISIYMSWGYLKKYPAEKLRRIQIVAAIVFLMALLADSFVWRNALFENIMGMSLLIAALGPVRHAFWYVLARWGRYSFGMYAVHLFVVQLLNEVRDLVFHFAPTWWTDLLTLMLCIPLSLLASIALTHYRWTHWLVPTGDTDAVLPIGTPVVAPA